MSLEDVALAARTSDERFALVAHYSDSNYGNHLVNLAAKRLLQHTGATVELISFQPDRAYLATRALGRLPFKLARLVHEGQMLDRIKSRVRAAFPHSKRVTVPSTRPTGPSEKRLAAFREFAQQELQPTFVPARDRARQMQHYTRVAIGSDQIWNYDYDLGPWNFADFSDPARVVCLAPSVGHERIPREWRRTYQRFAGRFNEVGVRELDWTTDVQDREGRPRFTPLIDPTLMIGADEWRSIAKRSPRSSGGVLVYELGAFLPEQREFVRTLAHAHGVSQLTLSEREGGEAWGTNAADFLAMVSTASCVVTDSFHGAVFAFLFDRPLVIIRRHGFAGSMNTRIENLMRQLHLTDRAIENLTPENALVHDYSKGRESLLVLRTNFRQYLERNGVAGCLGSPSE